MDLARNLKSDTVARLMPTAPLTVPVHCTIGEAVRLMRERRVGCLIVTEQRKVVGVFTERDLLVRVLAVARSLQEPVREVMTTDPATVSCRDLVRSAIRQMQKGGHRHLPVVDDAGRPTGILSVKRIVHYLVEHFPATIYNLPPGPPAVMRHREGA